MLEPDLRQFIAAGTFTVVCQGSFGFSGAFRSYGEMEFLTMMSLCHYPGFFGSLQKVSLEFFFKAIATSP